MSDQYERVRERLDQALRGWAKALSMLLLEAQKEKAIPKDLDPEMLAENLIASFQGALLRSKVKKSSEPLKNFIYLYFDRFLAQKEKVT
jgi:TetR/AcrR family transcriptional repressor of nem operon